MTRRVPFTCGMRPSLFFFFFFFVEIERLILCGRLRQKECTKSGWATSWIRHCFPSSSSYFFVDIGPKLASTLKCSGKDYFEYLSNPTQKSLFMKPIIADEAVKLISKFYQNKNPGHDGIGSFKFASVNLKPNWHFQICIVIHWFCVRTAEACYRLYPSTKRRIVLYLYYLNCFSKILERLFFNRCMDYINKNIVLNEKQFGSRPNHSLYVYGCYWISRQNYKCCAEEWAYIWYMFGFVKSFWYDKSWYLVVQVRILRF